MKRLFAKIDPVISKSRTETKADITDKTARSILDAEAVKRREKTDRLREQRLALAEHKG